MLLGIGAFAHPCILEKRPLSHQDIIADMGFGFEYGKSIQRGTGGNRYRLDVNFFENTLEGFFAIFNKIDKQSLGRCARGKMNVMAQFVCRLAVQKVEIIGTTHPYRTWLDVEMADLSSLNI